MSNLLFSEGAKLEPVGFIEGYLHTEDLEFVSFSADDPTHGYYKKPLHPIQEMHVKNLIVSKASIFMAKRMRPSTSWGNGIGFLELGTGVGTGSTQAPQAENANQTALRVSLIRKAITAWTCLDSGGNPTGTETNVLQLSTTFNASEGNGAVVEMGLFGGDATATAGSGYMFNYKTFPVWNKQSGMSLTIVWKLTF